MLNIKDRFSRKMKDIIVRRPSQIWHFVYSIEEVPLKFAKNFDIDADLGDFDIYHPGWFED